MSPYESLRQYCRLSRQLRHIHRTESYSLESNKKEDELYDQMELLWDLFAQNERMQRIARRYWYMLDRVEDRRKIRESNWSLNNDS